MKCATCQHAWYQAAQVESLDLAAVMGDDYVAQAAAPARPVPQQQGAQPQRGAQGGIQRVPPAPQNAAAAAAQNARSILAGAIGNVESQRNVQTGALGAPREPGRNVQAAPIRGQQNNAPPPGSPPVPVGAVSMMSRRNQQQRQPPQQPPQSWFAGTERSPSGAAGAPGAPQAGAVLAGGQRGQPPSPNAPGQGAVSWKQQAGAPQQGGPQVAPLGVAGVQAGPGAAPLSGQSMLGQAGAAGGPGQAAVSWMNPQGQIVPPGTPGAVPVQMPPGMQGGPGQAPQGMPQGMPQGAMGGPGGQPNVVAAALGAPTSRAQAQALAGLGAPTSRAQAQAAALSGQSMLGQAGAAAGPGQAPVSWMNPQGQIVPPGTPGAVPVQMPPGMQGAPGAPGAPVGPVGPGGPGGPGGPAQSLRQQGAPAAGPGEAAVSWMAPAGATGAPGAPGQPGRSMRDQGLPAGPGGAVVSQISNEIVAPGQGSHSLLDGAKHGGPGQAGQSMRDGAQGGPGQAGQSMRDGEQGGPGQAGQSMRDGAQGGPGQPGQSMLDNPAAGGPAAAGASGAPGAPGQPGQSMLEDGTSGGPGAGPAAEAATASAAKAKDGESAEGGASGGASGGPGSKKADAELVPGESRGAKASGELKTDPAKSKEEGASGGPGAKSAAAAAAALGGEDEDLVDPDADRPNFGTAEDEASEEESEEEAEDGFAQVAARASGGKAAAPVKIRKPINPAYTTAMMMMGFVGAIVATLWFARAEIAKVLPQIQALYDKVGVEAPKPGDGLSIAESSKRLQRIGGVETLVVRGYVANIGDIPRAVPGLRLELYNEKREVIQSENAPAPAALLDPGASAEYDIRLELPQLTAAKGGYAVVWDIQQE